MNDEEIKRGLDCGVEYLNDALHTRKILGTELDDYCTGLAEMLETVACQFGYELYNRFIDGWFCVRESDIECIEESYEEGGNTDEKTANK